MAQDSVRDALQSCRDAPQLAKSTMSGLGNSGRHALVGGGAGERGRRRTRQDQISRGALRPPVKLRIIGSAPNEENLFLLPDRFSKERTLSKVRSSRLT
jgi:hypothetical protein